MQQTFEVIAQDSHSRARRAKIHTPHGVIETPAFVVVGTHAEVRCLSSEDVRASGTQVVIASTYHLWRALKEKLADYSGLHTATGWEIPIMTDSGGFQVLSFGAAREYGINKIWVPSDEYDRLDERPEENAVRITEEGVRFFDEGEEIFLNPEVSVGIQEQLGADIIFAFDECTSPKHSREYVGESMERTHRWAKRSLAAKTRDDQMLYGVVQGGEFEDLRIASARAIADMPFDGVGIGGSFGKDELCTVLSWIAPHLPEERPRHLLGIGSIADIFGAIAEGVDSFDCVIPTREARHGGIWTRAGRMNLFRAEYRNDDSLLVEGCECGTCTSGATKAQVRALLKEKTKEGGRLATLHNVFFFNQLFTDIRASIAQGRFQEFRREVLGRRK